ncbi:MAG: sigma-70 family RNA polymerase sigma factor, partial [Patescibacteria group bacterium]
GFIDKDDLYQEALINLWERLREGRLNNKTSSYIVRGCYFHIQNYIRTHKVKNNTLSLEEPMETESGERFCLKDAIGDQSQDLARQLNSRFIVDDIMNNGLTKREKDVFRLLYAGLNIRQIAIKLGISHVRVVKIKQNISYKYKDKFLDT